MSQATVSIVTGYAMAIALFAIGVIALVSGDGRTFAGCWVLAAVCTVVPAGLGAHCYPAGQGYERDTTAPAETWRDE